jgi:hypothetical protein
VWWVDIDVSEDRAASIHDSCKLYGLISSMRTILLFLVLPWTGNIKDILIMKLPSVSLSFLPIRSGCELILVVCDMKSERRRGPPVMEGSCGYIE